MSFNKLLSNAKAKLDTVLQKKIISISIRVPEFYSIFCYFKWN